MKTRYQAIILLFGGAIAAGAQETPALPPAVAEPSPASPAVEPANESAAQPTPAVRSPNSAIAEPANGSFLEPASGAYVEPGTGAAAEPGSPFRWGSVVLDPHPSYGIFYTDGILVSPGRSASTFRQSFSPGFLAQLGPIWSLDYTPTWEQYSSRLFQNGFDQAATLAAKNSIDDWTLQFTQGYTRTDDPLVETGRQTREDDYATNLKAVYGTGDRTFLELGLDQDIQLSPTSPDSYEWSTLDWVHFPVSPQWDFAVGGGLGCIIMDPGYNMDFARPEGRITWRPADKLTVDLQGGMEFRTFVGSPDPRLDTPVFNASADYAIWDGTTLTADARRDVTAGYSENQVDDATNYSVGVQQRLLGHFYLGANAGRQDITYIAIGRQLADVRKDNEQTYQLSLSTVLFKRLSLEFEYTYIRNDSDLFGFGFLSSQYGLVAQYRY